MLGNFQYCNPTKLYFGEQSLTFLKEELQKYGPKVQLSYGRDSIKKNGIYDQIMKLLKEAGKTVFEDPGVMPNPTVEKLYEGCKIARENEVDLILAVGGGSVCDYAKAVSVSAYCEEDPWEKYYERMEEVDNRIIPVGCVLTMVGTGSEMNGGSVITNTERKRKIDHVFGENVFPKFSILNPVFTYTLPKYQMVAGIYDIFNHITEQYFSGEDARKDKKRNRHKKQRKEEELTLQKTMKIEGMMCGHCEATVKKTLEAIQGVEEAVVSHETGTAVVTLSGDVSSDILKEAVEAKDYQVLEIQ